MESLQLDLLVQIMEIVSSSERGWPFRSVNVANLRLVNRAFREASTQARISLELQRSQATNARILELCTTFPRASRLRLGCGKNSDDSGLEALQSLAQTLTQLKIIASNERHAAFFLPKTSLGMALNIVMGLKGSSSIGCCCISHCKLWLSIVIEDKSPLKTNARVKKLYK